MEVCLITGGAGFIGSHLVKALVARKCKVRVLDNLSTGTLANLGRCLRDVELIVGDLEDLDLVRELVEGVEVVFHLAAPPADETSLVDSGFPCHCDIGTAHILTASRDCRVRRLIYPSTTQVYGRGPGTRKAETDSVAPGSPFAMSKLSGEQVCTAFTLHYGLETVGRLRYSNVFGPRQSKSSPHARIVPEALSAMLLDQNPELEGSGFEPQDFIFVDDVVRANLLAADAPDVSGRVFNIAQRQETSEVEVVEMLNDRLGTQLLGVPTGRPLDQELQNLIDISRAEAELGFSPKAELRDALYRCVQSSAPVVVGGPRYEIPRLTEA